MNKATHFQYLLFKDTEEFFSTIVVFSFNLEKKGYVFL